MSVQGYDKGFERERFAFARVRVLRELADGRTEREIGERNQVSYAGFRSLVEDLKFITGCRDVWEMGRWWRENRASWLAGCEHQAGAVREEGYGA